MYLLFKYVFNIFAISMEKEIRLKKMVDEESYAIFISLYKEFRANPKYSRSDFILLKSFLAKIVYAQNEYEEDWGTPCSQYACGAHKRWATPVDYFSRMNITTNNFTPLLNTLRLLKKADLASFGFNYQKDLGLLL